MKLTPDELDWITQHLGIYKIPYQEVFDEVFDHMISAMEEARAHGNTLHVERLFQNVIDEHFNGSIGIDEMVVNQEKAYKNKVYRIFWQNFRSIMDWKAILFIAALMIVSLLISAKILITKVFLVAMLATVLTPLIYIYFATRIIKPGKGKKSLLRNYLRANSLIPLMFVNLYLSLPNGIDDINGNRALHFFRLNHPEIAALFLALSIIYSISSIYLCRQELQPYQPQKV